MAVVSSTPPVGYYHICYRLDGCWVDGEKGVMLGQWAGQEVCVKALHDPEHQRPCDGPFCSGDSYHKVCDCNAS